MKFVIKSFPKMFPTLLQVAIALSVFTGTWERNLGRRQIKGIENILRTANNARYDDELDDRERVDDQSNEIIGIEPLESYLNRLGMLGSTDKQNRFDDDKDRRDDDDDRLIKRDRINDNNQDRDDDLDRLFDDDQDRHSIDYRDRFDNDNRNRYNDKNREEREDRAFNDRLDKLFDDDQDRLNDDYDDRLDNDNSDRYNNNNRQRSFDDSLDRLFDDDQDLYDDEKDRDDDDDQDRDDDDDNQDRNDDDDRDRDDDDEDIENFLRQKSENICKKTGRCGCKQGGRCGEVVSDKKTVEDVRKLLDALEVKLNGQSRVNELTNRDANKDNTLNASNDAIKLDDLIKYVNNIADNKRKWVKSYKTLNKNHVDLIVINDLADIDEALRQSGLLKSDDLQDVRNEFVDLTRYDAKPRYSGKGVVLNLGKFYDESGNRNNRLDLKRSSSVFHSSEQMVPKDFFNLFGTLKEKVTRDLVKYVISNKAKEPNLNIMNFNQKEKIRLLKGEMRRNVERKTKEQVRSEVEDILFGHGGRIKVIPSDKTHNHIMIPNWMYKIVKDENTKLFRTPTKKKRMLPLTNQQKIKLFGKSKSVSPVGKFWRRSFRQNSQKYGLPFELSLQGLAQ